MVDGITKGPKGAHGVDVTFEIGVDGTLKVEVVESNGIVQE